MYKTFKDQLEFENFDFPYGNLNQKNSWIQLSKIIPWDFVEELYVKSLSQSNQGKPDISSRIAFGSLVIHQWKIYEIENWYNKSVKILICNVF